jgi:hypothetical protein
MGSVSGTNPGLAALLQTLSNVNSPVLSSPAAMAAIEKASPSDIVKLSAAATQLSGVGAMFGMSAGSADSSGSDPSSLLANLEASLTGSAAGSNPVLAQATADALKNASPADIVQLSMAASQAMSVDAMFGISDGSSDGTGSDMSNLLATLNTALTKSAANTSGAAATTAAASSTADSEGASLAKQFAAQQTALQMAQTEALLGSGSTGS